ncbi:hypothetical protein B0H14DRAFT_3615769 [Mycena olivaceomarginata]|nr:hypothetical protein B0H14DRAFT_3615769 [Mycena olivaceomarginata]
MPPELVCGIFALLLEDSDEILPKPLWHLGHICRSWRLFVLGDTQFWSCITIPTAPLRSGDCAMIENQLLRSANAPLKVYWFANDSGHTMDPRMAGLVVAECSRWTSLRLGVRSSEALDWLRPVNGRLPLLQKLEVFHGYNVVVPDVFWIAPNLRKVNLGQWPLDLQEASPKISIPWGQITHYRGTDTGKSQLSIVRAAPSLVQSILGFEDSLFPAHSSITLPHLRSLYISDAHILEYLSTPVLEDLFYTDLPTTHTSRLLSFVRSSQYSPVLKTLVLMDCCIDPDLITVLRDLPNLALLFIETSSQEQGQPAFFDAMTISGTSLDNACPNVTLAVVRRYQRFPAPPLL